MQRHRIKKRRLSVQPLECRRVLAASLGWDGPGLGSAELSYHIEGSPNSLTQAETNAAIETALAAWSSAADITFTPTNQAGLRDSIDISFVNIDSTAGTLAQAYFPDDVNPARIAGDIQFDISESWEVGNAEGNRAFDLTWVAVHEIGHSLGLDHTDASGSLLSPFVSPSQVFTNLSNDDVSAIQELYSSSSVEGTPDGTDANDPDVGDTDSNEMDSHDADSNNNASGDPVPSDDDTSDPGDTDNNPFPRHRWRRGGRWHRFGGRLDAELVNQNYVNPTDVNGDLDTTALDALTIINQLEKNSSDDPSEFEIVGLCDTNGDGAITASDALTVINAMNEFDASGSAQVEDAATTASNAIDEEVVEVDDSPTALVDVFDDTVIPIDDTVDPVDNTVDPVDDTVDPVDDSDNSGGEASDSDEDEIDDGGLVDDTGDEEEHCHDGRHGNRSLHRISQLDSDELLAQYDTNEDGVLDQDEVNAKLWRLLSGADVDSDGLLTSGELADEIFAAKGEIFAAKDADSDGLWTESDFSDRFWEKVSVADVDSDGAVTFDEWDAWIESKETNSGDSRRLHQHHRAIDRAITAIARARHRHRD